MARPFLYLAFFLSGAAALAYESVWARYLGLLVGHDAYAQVVVLVIFLGGMSAGAALVARRSSRITRPLLGYAVVEGLVGLFALVFHGLFTFTSDLAYGTILPSLAGGPLLVPVTWLLAALLILPPSILLGSTFPLMSAAIIRMEPARPGRTLALLYFTNSLGAALGVLVAGFVLTAMAGLPGTLVAAGATNLFVALVAYLAARAAGELRAGAAPPPPLSTAPGPSSGPRLDRLLLGVAFGTAVASFAYEIDWIRMLALVLGSSTHAFELMLSAFILGLAIGALAVRQSDRIAEPLRLLGWVQVAMGVLAVLTLPVYMATFDWIAGALEMFTPTDAGYAGFSVARYGLALAVMLPATICAGMTLPLITRSLLVCGAGEAAIGRVYAWNTLGSIIGVALAALVLLPTLGLKPMLVAAGALDVALGLAVFHALGRTRQAAGAGLLAFATMAMVIVLVPLERRVVVSGVFQQGRRIAPDAFTLPFYADGRTATVAVGVGHEGSRWISTNGKPDASLGPWWQVPCDSLTVRYRFAGDEGTQALLPIVTQSFHPGARRAAVIGLGSGVSSHVMLAQATLEEVTTIEIEPAMVRGARELAPANDRVFQDPRSRLVIGDAKAHFAATGRQWDVILSEPSNPWIGGVSSLFTVEFYQRVTAALAPGGIFAQWLQAYQLDDPLVLTVLAAIDRVFGDWRVFQLSGGDLLVVATTEPALPPMTAGPVLDAPALRNDLCRFAPISPGDLDALVLADAALLRPVVARIGQPNSDFYPVLDLGAERARFRRTSAAGLLSLGWDWFNLAGALLDRPTRVTVPGELPFTDVTLIRESWARARLDSTHRAAERELAAPLRLVRHWRALREAPVAAPDWAEWLQVHRRTHLMHHAGIAGSVDTAFVEGAAAAAARLGAERSVIAVLEFRRAVQAWDAAAALAAAEALRETGAIGPLVEADEVRDGAVVMALRAGRRDVALDWLVGLSEATARAPGDLRDLVLEGWVEQLQPGRTP